MIINVTQMKKLFFPNLIVFPQPAEIKYPLCQMNVILIFQKHF